MQSVVVVDDHPAIRLAVRSALEASEQFKIVGEANNGSDALTMIYDLAPGLAIVDLGLPKMSGLELIEQLRATDHSTKLLVFSAQQEAIFAPRAMQAGANGFLSKTEEMHKLVDAAQAVLSGYSIFPSSALLSLTSPIGVNANVLIQSLSDRELTVLQYLARGMSNKEIADTLLISNKTVSSYKARIFDKLGISTVVELVDFARANHLTKETLLYPLTCP